jgi:hypothetical protein
VAALLLLVLTTAAWLSGSFPLFTRGLWYDEGVTQTIVADPDLLHSMRALAGGVDMHPPAYYLALRAFAAVLGRADEVVLRSFAFLCTVAGLAGVYATLRFAYPPLASLAGALGLCAQPLVLNHAVEARHYNLLFAEVAWFCYLLLRSRAPGARPRVVVCLMLTAALTATTHYFGIICVALVLAGDLLVFPRPAGANRVRALALTAGVIAVLACAPMVRSQRASVSVPSWLAVPDAGIIRQVLSEVFLPGYLGLGLVGAAGLIALHRHGSRPAQAPPAVRRNPRRLAGVVSLALLPFVLLALSYLYQPVFMARYALPAVIALAPLLAWICARAPRWAVVALCAGFCVASGLGFRTMTDHYQSRDRDRALFLAFLREKCPGDAPIVFQTPLRLSFVSRYANDMAARCYQLDYERDDLDEGLDPRFFLFNRDQARQEAAYYGRPALLNCGTVKPPVVYVVFDEPDLLPRFRSLAGAEQRALDFGVYELRFPQPESAEKQQRTAPPS